MVFEDSLAFHAYLCLAHICGMLENDYHYYGAANDYPDQLVFSASLSEVFGFAIDKVFDSQFVADPSGKPQWAFTSTADRTGVLGARLYYDRSLDVYFLAHPPTRVENQIDSDTNEMTIANQGIPDKFSQAAQLMDLVKPEYREKIVVIGHSLGGGLAAYAALKTAEITSGDWVPRTVAFDPLGLNEKMMAGAESVTSLLPNHVDWCYIAGSWVAGLNVVNELGSVGAVWELPQDPVRAAAGLDPHDLENVRYGLTYLWEHNSN